MKKTIIIFIHVLLSSLAFGQSTIKPGTFNPKIDSVAEQLIAMALNNPTLHYLENSALSSEYEYKRTKTSILNNLVVTGNLNEFTIDQTFNSDPLKQSIVYPRYNIGVAIPLGLFTNSSKQNKAAYYRTKAAYNQVEIEKQSLRREVQTAYQDYLMYKDLLALQQEIVQDAKVFFLKQEKKFEDGQITLENYTAANKAYSAEASREITITRDLKITEAQLEALIGMRIDDALEQIAVRSSSKLP